MATKASGKGEGKDWLATREEAGVIMGNVLAQYDEEFVGPGRSVFGSDSPSPS